jgi:hypothetical protein
MRILIIFEVDDFEVLANGPEVDRPVFVSVSCKITAECPDTGLQFLKFWSHNFMEGFNNDELIVIMEFGAQRTHIFHCFRVSSARADEDKQVMGKNFSRRGGFSSCALEP